MVVSVVVWSRRDAHHCVLRVSMPLSFSVVSPGHGHRHHAEDRVGRGRRGGRSVRELGTEAPNRSSGDHQAVDLHGRSHMVKSIKYATTIANIQPVG